MPFNASMSGSFGAQGKFGKLVIGTLSFPANNAIQLYDAGYRNNGLYYINTSTGIKQVYCDLNTISPTDNKAGWMLVGSWATASNWSQSATTSTSVFSNSPLNCFSANFGTMNMNYMRMLVSSDVNNSGTNSTSCDFYFYWNSVANWRTRWVTDSSNNIRWSTTTNSTGSIPREALQQFNFAYNIKYSYQVGQVWNNISDGTQPPIAGRQGDWWNGLNGTQTSIGWFGAGDGSLAILPQGSSYTGAGQDCNSNNVKFGSDDTSSGPNVAYFGSSPTDDMNNNTGTKGSNTNFWLWIK